MTGHRVKKKAIDNKGLHPFTKLCFTKMNILALIKCNAKGEWGTGPRKLQVAKCFL